MKRTSWIRTKHTHFWIIYWSPHSFLANHLPPFYNLTSQFIQHMRDRTKIFGHESTPSFGIISPSSQSIPHTLSTHDSRFMNIMTKGTPTSDLSQPACGLAPRSFIAVTTTTLPPSGSPASTAIALHRAGKLIATPGGRSLGIVSRTLGGAGGGASRDRLALVPMYLAQFIFAR